MKVRLRYRRDGKIRFISHRDMARILERSLRKLRLPIAYSEGFSPRPKLSFGLALSVGYESDAEYLDVDLATSVDLEDLPRALSDALPDGLSVVAAAELAPGTMSLQQAITSCRWMIEILGEATDVAAAVSQVLAAAELPLERERKGKTTTVDVRPAILGIEVAGPTDAGVQLVADLATETVTIRPSELVRVLSDASGSGALTEGRVRRTHQFSNVDGAPVEPLVAPSGSDPVTADPAAGASTAPPDHPDALTASGFREAS